MCERYLFLLEDAPFLALLGLRTLFVVSPLFAGVSTAGSWPEWEDEPGRRYALTTWLRFFGIEIGGVCLS